MSAELTVSLRLVGTLALAGLLSGLGLVGVYQVTRPRILTNQAEALERAIYKVLPGTAETATLVAEDGDLRNRDEVADGAGELIYTGIGPDGNLVGYAVAAQGAGFQDTVKLLYGIDPERRVITGLAILDSRETPGLGDKIIFDEAFHKNFEALTMEPTIVLVKKGAKTRDNEVDGITGATISSEAVVAILNRSAKRWLPVIDAARGRLPENAGQQQQGGGAPAPTGDAGNGGEP